MSTTDTCRCLKSTEISVFDQRQTSNFEKHMDVSKTMNNI